MSTVLRDPGTTARAAANDGQVCLAGVLAAVRAAGLGLVATAGLVLLAWASAGPGSAGAADAVRAAGQVWLLSHHAPLQLPGGTFGLAPLGLALLPGVAVATSAARAARGAGVTDLRRAGILVVSTAAGYASLAVAVT